MKLQSTSISLHVFLFCIFTLVAHAGEPKQQPFFGASQGNEKSPIDHPHNYEMQNGQSSWPTRIAALADLRSSLSTMQDRYFSLWLGKWTTASDWTGAVMGTYVSATLSSLSRSREYQMWEGETIDGIRTLDVKAQSVENEINKYFGQRASYYFGEDHFSIRMQAYDDMLWVVLGWLEATQFIEGHAGRHYAVHKVNKGKLGENFKLDEGALGWDIEWHAWQFIPAFAHRARIFYELSEEGWDDRLCGGGMTWNPRLLPYKNAITNELFISASISMYLHFTGDDNCSPFIERDDTLKLKHLNTQCDEDIPGRYDDKYLANAVKGYEWLKKVDMKNDDGLYVDGYHISGYKHDHSRTKCDERNEMVYTYNQGVILTGLRGLWEATGNMTYLEDGHELIRNVIKATGWTATEVNFPPILAEQQIEPMEQDYTKYHDKTRLGTNGILEEQCDPSGECSQDGQTFKGIFFHHITTFCAPLPRTPADPRRTHTAKRETAILHRRSCNIYAKWVTHNAQASLSTRDGLGRFGSWWGTQGDDNDRGRGRTIETQGTGLAVVRAQWEFLRWMEVEKYAS